MSTPLIVFGAALGGILAAAALVAATFTGIRLAHQRRNGCDICRHAHYRCADCWQPLTNLLPCPDHICPHELEQLTAIKHEHICLATDEGDQ